MDPSPKPTAKKTGGRKKKKGALDQDAAKYHKVDDMFKAHSMKSKKDVATTSGYNTRAAASAGEPSASSEERAAALPAGGDDSGGETLPSDSSEEPTGGTSLTNMEMRSEKNDQYPKEEELHDVPHSFFYTIRKYTGEQVTVSCDRSQTIMDVLKPYPTYEKNAKKHEGQELVIVRGKPGSLKAISAHFPCCLIDQKEHLIIKFIKGNVQHPKNVVVRPGTTRNDLVVFHVEKDGRILNTTLTETLKFLSVYAYKGEPIEDALKRDGRFKSDVFSKLKDKNEYNRTTNISNPVDDDLEGRTFKLIQGKTKSQSNQPVPSTITSPSTSSAQHSATNDPVNTDMAEKTAKQNPPPTWAKPCPIPDSKEILDLLREQFKDLVKHMKDREGKSKSIKELFRVEYGKNTQRMACMDVKMMKQLMVRADSVCQVRVGGKWQGSGFLLFDKFILTCAHVIEDVYDHVRKQLKQKVTVIYEHLESQIDSVPVKPEVVVFEKLTDESGCYHDWALLELDSPLGQACPSGLLENIVTSPQRGGICIIGHPGGGVKKADPCFIIPVGDREKDVIDRYKEVQPLITRLHFDEDHLTRLVNQSPVLAYDSCFSYGSSGSPVFDEFCNVVAMHTGGYVYETRKGQPQKVHPQSFIEYAQPLSSILPRIIIQIVERQKFDVLEAYLHYTSIHQKDTFDQVKEDVKKIVETQKPFAFEKELNNYAVDSENIKEFIKFFCPQDHSEPMDTDQLLTATLLQDS